VEHPGGAAALGEEQADVLVVAQRAQRRAELARELGDRPGPLRTGQDGLLGRLALP
jgi:hypothetical protein